MNETQFKCKIQVPKHSIKKNNKQIFQNKATGKRFIASNSKAQYLENYLTHQLLIQKLKQRLETIECDLAASFKFYYPENVYLTKLGKRSHRVADLSNLLEAPQDALQKAKVILNDSLICELNDCKRLISGDSFFYLEIELKKLD